MRLAHVLTILLAAVSAAGCSQLPLPFSATETAEVTPASTVVERAPIAAPRRTETQQVALAQNYSPASLPESPYKLDAGDRLRVVVFGQEGVTNSYAVDAAGNITMPLIGAVPARGLTTQQLGAIDRRETETGLYP